MASERSPLLASTGPTAPRDIRTASGQSSETTTLAGDEAAAGKADSVSALDLPSRKKVIILAGTFLAVFLSVSRRAWYLQEAHAHLDIRVQAIDMTITAACALIRLVSSDTC